VLSNGNTLTAPQFGHGHPGLSTIGIRCVNVARHAPHVIVNFGPDPNSCMMLMHHPLKDLGTTGVIVLFIGFYLQISHFQKTPTPVTGHDKRETPTPIQRNFWRMLSAFSHSAIA